MKRPLIQKGVFPMRWTNGITITGMFAILMFSGCNWDTTNPIDMEVVSAPEQGGGQTYLDKTAIRDDVGKETNNADDAAMEWAKKCAVISSKHDQLLQENRQLKQKQQTHQQQVTTLKTELGRAERELAQANSMLLEMKTELEKWKTNVLGFRNEIRQSQKAQLDALVRILTLIGGEVVEKSPEAQPAKQTTENKEEKTGGAT